MERKPKEIKKHGSESDYFDYNPDDDRALEVKPQVPIRSKSKEKSAQNA